MFRCANVSKGLPPTLMRKNLDPVPLTETELRTIFKNFDANKDGRLSKEELQKAFTCLGSHLPGWRADRGLHRADSNHDGYISEDEIDDLVKYALKCGYTFANLHKVDETAV